MTENYSLIPKTADMPADADFCLIMDSDLMEPVISKGAQVFVSRNCAPAELEAGVFWYRGMVYCRQWCEDYAGNLHLLCANPLRESENLCLGKTEKGKCLCLGKVLLKKKAPMPVYV